MACCRTCDESITVAEHALCGFQDQRLCFALAAKLLFGHVVDHFHDSSVDNIMVANHPLPRHTKEDKNSSGREETL